MTSRAQIVVGMGASLVVGFCLASWAGATGSAEAESIDAETGAAVPTTKPTNAGAETVVFKQKPNDATVTTLSCEAGAAKTEVCQGPACLTTRTSCFPFRCKKGTCLATCTDDGQCAADATCLHGSCQLRPLDLSAKCAKGVTTVSTCFAGKCTEKYRYPCFPYACDTKGKMCQATCETDDECASGANCDRDANQCGPIVYKCLDAYTVVGSSGSEESCSPYTCKAGACEQQCSTDGDCAASYSCFKSGRCQPTPDGTPR